MKKDPLAETRRASVTRRSALPALAVIVAAIAALNLASCAGSKEGNAERKSVKDIDSIAIENVDPTKVKDGAYEQREDYGLVTAKVGVLVKGGRIEDIKLAEHRHGPGKKHSGEPVIARVIEKQSLAVDVVSGATGSSKVILKAIEGALKQGM